MGERRTPEDPLDILLVEIWEEILGRPVGLQDSLVRLGATESQIERLMARIEREMGRSVVAQDWNPPGTIEALAAVLASQGVQNEVPPSTAPAGRPRVLTRNTDGERPPLVFVHGDFNGAGFYCLSLAAQLGAAQPFHGLMPHGIDGGAIPDSIEEMARDHLDTLRTIQSAGPYRLGGHCNGGLIAFEMARRLEAEGERVAALVMVASDVRSTAQPIPAAPLWRRALRYYWRRLREAARGAPPPRADSRGARAVAERQRARTERIAAYARALRTYKPGRYDGRVVLLWPEEQGSRHGNDLTQGWGAVAPAVEVRAIPGGHLSCVTTHAKVVADEIRRALDGAEDRAAPTLS